jgi:hypothetical protein
VRIVFVGMTGSPQKARDSRKNTTYGTASIDEAARRKKTMRVKIKETGEIVELSLIDPKTGCDCVEDFIGNAGAFNREFSVYDADNDCYIAYNDDVEWWQTVISVHDHVASVIDAIGDPVIDDDVTSIQETVREMMSGDLDYFGTPEEFDIWFADELAAYDYTMTIHSDGSIGFSKK